MKRQLAHLISAAAERTPVRGTKRLAYLFSRALLGSPERETQVETRYGFKMFVNPRKLKGVDHSIYYSGTYEPGTLSILTAVLENGDTFIDVGANIGLMSLLAAKTVGEKGGVYSFEPDPEVAEILRRNSAANGFKWVKIINHALGAKKGKATLYLKENLNRGASSMVKGESSRKIDIDVDTLDSIVEKRRINRIKAVKIDVEGWEIEVLKGMGSILEKNKPVMILEVISEYKDNKIFDIVRGYKYRIFRLTRGKDNISKLVEIKESSELPEHDNIFCFTNNHLNTLPLPL